MNILVFLKQVPASTEIKMDPDTHTLIRSGARSQTNPDDLHALQMAIEIAGLTKGKVTAITMGPPQAESVLREAMLYGADEGVLLTDRAFAGSDTLSTGAVLAATVAKLSSAQLLLFGKQAIDGDTAQVGPSVAAQLDIPQLTDVKRIDSVTATHIVVEKLNGNNVQTWQSTYPCVLTVSKEANDLPSPSLRAWEVAQHKPITIWGLANLKLNSDGIGLTGSPTRVVSIAIPENTSSITWLSGVAELADVLMNIEYKHG